MQAPHEISETTRRRNIAISDLYTSKEFNDCINKMEPDHLRADLRNEVALVLLSKPDDLIVAMAQANELKFYAVRLIINMAMSNNSQFAKTYRGSGITYPYNNGISIEYCDSSKLPNIPVHEINGRVVRELKEDAVFRFINTELYWYDKEIVKMYVRLGSYRRIQDHIGIPWKSCYNTVLKSIKRIKEEVLNVTE